MVIVIALSLTHDQLNRKFEHIQFEINMTKYCTLLVHSEIHDLTLTVGLSVCLTVHPPRSPTPFYVTMKVCAGIGRFETHMDSVDFSPVVTLRATGPFWSYSHAVEEYLLQIKWVKVCLMLYRSGIHGCYNEILFI